MTITAKVILHSVSKSEGKPIVSVQLRYPRFVHSEVMTHRAFSRNASSSRAIPVNKLIEDIRRDPAMPIHWGKNQPGMQAHEEVSEGVREVGIQRWMLAMDDAIRHAEWLNQSGFHKQIVNRGLEAYSHINTLVTATQWDNWFTLRDHEDAQPEIRELAKQMRLAFEASTPHELGAGEWHLPYIEEQDYDQAYTAPDETLATDPDGIGRLIKASVARCARVSYLTHEGKAPEIEKDLALYERLVGAVPLHASPTEHQACPDRRNHWVTDHSPAWSAPSLHGNFVGWKQLRKFIEIGEFK